MDFAIYPYKVHQRDETRAKNCLSVSHPRPNNEFGLSMASSTSLRYNLIPMSKTQKCADSKDSDGDKLIDFGEDPQREENETTGMHPNFIRVWSGWD